MEWPKPQAELANGATIERAVLGIIDLAAKGIRNEDFIRYIGYEPDELQKFAEDAAAEEFAVVPGLPDEVPATGRMRELGLSRRQRDVVKEALAETFILAIEVGTAIERARHEGQE